jgi:hypothetical protein
MTIFKKIMIIPTSPIIETDRAGIESLIYSLTWLQRTYIGSFPDDQNSLVTNLHNFLAIPLQFTITAYQYANYTAGGSFSLPEDTMTVATDGWYRSRLAIQPWTGWLFIVAAAALLLAIIAGILWILGQKAPLPFATGIGDFDNLRLARELKIKSGTGRTEVRKKLIDFAGDRHKDSTWGLAREMGGWEVVAYDVQEV